jgi:hypothetical protein
MCKCAGSIEVDNAGILNGLLPLLSSKYQGDCGSIRMDGCWFFSAKANDKSPITMQLLLFRF